MSPSTSPSIEFLVAFLPFLVMGGLLTLAFVADRPAQAGLRWLVYGIVAAIDGLLILFGATFGLVMIVPGVAASLRSSYALWLGTAEAAERLVGGLPTFGWLCAIAGLLGWLLLWRPMRQAATRWLPLDPDRTVHALALQLALYAVVVAAVTAVFVPALAVGDAAQLERLADTISLAGLVGQFTGFAVVAVLGVGWLVSRSGRETLARLGLGRRLYARWWLGATLVGLVSAWMVDAAWQALSPESLAEVARISEILFSPLARLDLVGPLLASLPPPVAEALVSAGEAVLRALPSGSGELLARTQGALLVAVLPAISEELLFRGAAQPRFGLLATALLFMVVHTQYTLSPALAQILAMGLVLGLVRERANTTTSIAVHASYNFLIFLVGI
jgi:membrane protease YdiL (CAAX protease family)